MSQSHITLPAKSPAVSREYTIPYERDVEIDFTRFPDRETFTDLCDRHELTETYTVENVTRVGIRERYWHWYNEEVLMITCANPVTGEKRHAAGQDARIEPGYASSIMLQGGSEAVINLYEDIVTSAAYIKGGEVYESRITADGTHQECKERYPEQLQQFRDDELNTIQ